MNVPAALETPIDLTIRERMWAYTAVGSARALLALTRRRTQRIAAALACICSDTTPEADSELAVRARAAICTVSLHCASNHGCLLRSVALVIAVRMRGRRIRWHLGVATRPTAVHAWCSTPEGPVREVSDPTLLYTTTHTV